MLGPAFAVIAYLVGSISFAEIIARRAGIDIRAAGSNNPGATNIGRVVGKQQGRRVLALDVLKGVIPAAIAIFLLDPLWLAITGFCGVLGHCFPLWHRFRGGKGAATAAGVLVVLVPLAGAAAAITYLLLRKLTRRASVGSLMGAVIGGVIATLLARFHTLPVELACMAWGIALLVFLRHHDNLARLIAGTEPPS